MCQPSPNTCTIALQHSKGPEAGGELAAKKKAPGAIFNVAQRRPEGWPPGMAGHKKPASLRAFSCCTAAVADSVDLGGQLTLGVALEHGFQGDRFDLRGIAGGAEGFVAGDADIAHGGDGGAE